MATPSSQHTSHPATDQDDGMNELILIVDHNPQVCKQVREYLEEAGYSVQVASSTPTDSTDFESTKSSPSLLVVSMNALMRAGDDGFVGQHISDALRDRTPWLALLDSASPQHRMIALDYGAIECIVKPFTARELVERVETILGRAGVHADRADIVIDSWAMKLLVRGSEVPATTLEFKLLEYLARHPGQVFTRDFLLDAVWGDLRFISPRSVDACIRRIREKIETDSARPTMLKTVRGVGYRMDATTAWQSAPNEICNCAACRTRSTALRFQTAGVRRKRASLEG
jgi:DNA-binding response OmpR family regulator